MPTPLIAEVSAITPILIGSAANAGAARARPNTAPSRAILCEFLIVGFLSAAARPSWRNAAQDGRLPAQAQHDGPPLSCPDVGQELRMSTTVLRCESWRGGSDDGEEHDHDCPDTPRSQRKA